MLKSSTVKPADACDGEGYCEGGKGEVSGRGAASPPGLNHVVSVSGSASTARDLTSSTNDVQDVEPALGESVVSGCLPYSGT